MFAGRTRVQIALAEAPVVMRGARGELASPLLAPAAPLLTHGALSALLCALRVRGLSPPTPSY